MQCVDVDMCQWGKKIMVCWTQVPTEKKTNTVSCSWYLTLSTQYLVISTPYSVLRTQILSRNISTVTYFYALDRLLRCVTDENVYWQLLAVVVDLSVQSDFQIDSTFGHEETFVGFGSGGSLLLVWRPLALEVNNVRLAVTISIGWSLLVQNGKWFITVR